MKQAVKNQKGITLIELIVSAALLGIFCTALATLISPFSNLFVRIQKQNQAQQISDTVMEDLRGALLGAQGYVKLSGGTVEFKTLGGYVEVLSAEAVSAPMSIRDAEGNVVRTEGADYPDTDPAVPRAGTVHASYYMPNETGSGPDLADQREYADLHAAGFYMGNTVSLNFAQAAGDADGVTALTVTVTVKDAGGDAVYTQATTLDLPYAPAAG